MKIDDLVFMDNDGGEPGYYLNAGKDVLFLLKDNGEQLVYRTTKDYYIGENVSYAIITCDKVHFDNGRGKWQRKIIKPELLVNTVEINYYYVDQYISLHPF